MQLKDTAFSGNKGCKVSMVPRNKSNKRYYKNTFGGH